MASAGIKKNNSSIAAIIFSLVAAIIYTVIAVYTIINRISYVNESDYESITGVDLVCWIGLVGLAVSLFIRNKYTVAIAAGGYALLSIYYSIRFFDVRDPYYFLYYLLAFFAYAVYIFIIILAVKGNTVVKRIWFLAGLLLLIGTILYWMPWIQRFGFTSLPLRSILLDIAEILALVFAGSWIGSGLPDSLVNQFATFNPQVLSSAVPCNETIDGIEEKVIIKGTPVKNKIALIILILGIGTVIVSFLVATYYYDNVEAYEYFGYGLGGYYPYRIIYDYDFTRFYFSKFFSLCIYGYMLIDGIIAIIVGLIMKSNTEKCEITVTDKCILGKTAHGKTVDIPLNQVTGVRSCSFRGVSVASIGYVNKFHCIANHNEVIKAISYILANPQSNNSSIFPTAAVSTGENLANQIDQLKGLKELLDSGILTQEEFDAKKKEILGL